MTGSTLSKVMIGVLTGIGGTILGALLRQPEINKLKKQVRKLQKEIERLQINQRAQDEQIKELIIKYKALKIFQFRKKKEGRENIRGLLLYQYGTYDYLDLLIGTVKGEKEMKREDILFYNMFDKVIEGKSISEKEKAAIKEYVMNKHWFEISMMKTYDITDKFEELSGIDIKK